MARGSPRRTTPAHEALVRPGVRAPLRLLELPPWHGWRYTSEAARARRWIEQYLVVPTGYGAGAPMRVAKFQRRILEQMYSWLATFASLPAANGKTTFLGAVALERLCRGDDYAEVDVVATKEEQAGLLVEAAKRMVESCPALVDLCTWHSRDGILEYRPTGSRLAAHPAKLSATQGLNFSLAIIDEVGFAHDETIESLLARLGKRPDARLIGIGTPGFEPNMLQRLRAASADGELPHGVGYLEWSAEPGADLTDRRAWRQANPAVAAGFLSEAALELQSGVLSEREFRTYHLGQWIDTSAGWLPPGAWDGCPAGAPPPDGSEVVLAVEGTFRRGVAVMVAGMDGTVAFGWAKDAALDAELREAIEQAASQWTLLEVTHPRRIRAGLFADLASEGIPTRAWDSSADNEASSANEFYRAILEGRLAHDHEALVSQEMGKLRVRWGVDGSLRLARPDDGTFVDAAFAARAAWWRASQLAEGLPADTPRVY